MNNNYIKIPSTLFHYCDTNAFHSIISNMNLRLCNAFETNDFLERKYLDRFIDLNLNKYVDECPQDKLNIFKKSVATHFKLNRDIPCYFVGFSEAEDLLSQWRGYANDGEGVAIGFNSKYFNLKHHIPSTSVNSEDTIGLTEVIYDEQLLKDKVDATIVKHLSKFKEDNYASNSPAMIECSSILVRLSSWAKNPAFSEEKEWRVLYMPLITIHEVRGDLQVLGKLTDLQFHVKKNNCLSSYFELSFTEKKSEQPINKIIIGPRNRTSIESITAFLSSKGIFNVKIVKSRSSYR